MGIPQEQTRSTLVFIEPQDLVTYRSDPALEAEVLGRFFKSSELYAVGFSRGLSREDIADICRDSVYECIALFRAEDVPFTVVQLALTRAIDRHLKRAQREPSARAMSLEQAAPHHQAADDEGLARLTERVVGSLLIYMEAALKSLSDAYHDLVVLDGGLEDFFPPRGAPLHVIYKNQGSKERASQRARSRWGQLVEGLINRALLEGEGDPDILKLALRIVQGAKIEDLLELADELDVD